MATATRQTAHDWKTYAHDPWFKIIDRKTSVKRHVANCSLIKLSFEQSIGLALEQSQALAFLSVLMARATHGAKVRENN